MKVNLKNRIEYGNEAVSVAVFDICDTLYYSNTTHDFIGFLAPRKFGSFKRIIYYLVNDKISPLRYALIFFSVLTGIDLHKKIGIKLLAGISKAEINALADDFVAIYLDRRKIAEVHQRLAELSHGGSEIVLCSASIEPVVASVAAGLAVENFTCTTLEYMGDVLTGRIEKDITGKKLEALSVDLGVTVPDEAMSDNREDLSLLLAAGRGIAVVHSDRHSEFWKNNDIQIIDLRKGR